MSMFQSHSAGLYHVGGHVAKRSTLSDANALRPSEVFSPRWWRVQRGLHHKLGDATYLIAATSLPLSGMCSDWVHFSSKSCGVKAPVIYDADAEHPIYAPITPARVIDIKAAQQIPIEPGATYVVDFAYYDSAWWASLHAAGCRIVTRFKKNTPLTVSAKSEVPEGGNILYTDHEHPSDGGVQDPEAKNRQRRAFEQGTISAPAWRLGQDKQAEAVGGAINGETQRVGLQRHGAG